MSTPLHFNRFFNPLMLWADVAVQTQDLMVCAAQVVAARVRTLGASSLADEATLKEVQRMCHEKLTAAGESGAAIANQLRTAQVTLPDRAARQWLVGATAFACLATSTETDQFARHLQSFTDAAARSGATWSQWSSSGARVIQRGMKPIHRTARSNAERLGATSA